MVSNGFPNVTHRVNSIISGRSPPLYCTLIALISMQGHQNHNPFICLGVPDYSSVVVIWSYTFLLPPRPWPWCGGGVGSARCSLGTHPPCESSTCQRFNAGMLGDSVRARRQMRHCSRKLVCTQCTRCVGRTRRQGWRSGRRRADGVVEPSIVKNKDQNQRAWRRRRYIARRSRGAKD